MITKLASLLVGGLLGLAAIVWATEKGAPAGAFSHRSVLQDWAVVPHAPEAYPIKGFALAQSDGRAPLRRVTWPDNWDLSGALHAPDNLADEYAGATHAVRALFQLARIETREAANAR